MNLLFGVCHKANILIFINFPETGWRCPACQNVTEAVPCQYRCFCNKAVEPLWNRQDTPHTCGEVCGKSREIQRPLCVHHCTLLCHPGPCPPCLAQVVR